MWGSTANLRLRPVSRLYLTAQRWNMHVWALDRRSKHNRAECPREASSLFSLKYIRRLKGSRHLWIFWSASEPWCHRCVVAWLLMSAVWWMTSHRKTLTVKSKNFKYEEIQKMIWAEWNVLDMSSVIFWPFCDNTEVSMVTQSALWPVKSQRVRSRRPALLRFQVWV